MMSRQIIIFISLLIILILGIGLIWPKYQDLNTLQNEIREKKVELQYEEEYFLNLENISAELKKYTDNLSKIDSALPDDPSLPDLLDFLQKTAAQSGLVLEKIDSASVSLPEASKIKEIQLNLAFTGSYPSFKNFLSILEKSARLIEIENISFSPEKKGSATFNLKIKVYSY